MRYSGQRERKKRATEGKKVIPSNSLTPRKGCCSLQGCLNLGAVGGKAGGIARRARPARAGLSRLISAE